MLELPRPEHPRPQFVRADWLSLNGEWEFEKVFEEPYLYHADRLSYLGYLGYLVHLD